MDFLYVRSHDQVSWADDACKIEFGSVPNVSIFPLEPYSLGMIQQYPFCISITNFHQLAKNSLSLSVL